MFVVLQLKESDEKKQNQEKEIRDKSITKITEATTL